MCGANRHSQTHHHSRQSPQQAAKMVAPPLLLRCLVLATFAAAFSASVNRREFVVAGTTAAASIATIISPSPASADGTQTPAVETYVKGVATLQADLSTDDIGPGAALYVTARPNRPDNVPRAILDGSRGKPPPILAARYADPKFPYDFSLTSENLTPEGASIVEGSNSAWWQGEDLVVSCRFDSDGVAATRDPTDLVGRGFYSSKDPKQSVLVELEGRGLFGKSVTAKK